MAPTGSVTFISKAWGGGGGGGRVSDKVITQNFGFLNMIEGGDLVLVDRGFNIEDELLIWGAKLEIPAFTKGKKQLSAREVEKSRQIAHVQIHVERVIGQMKQKFTILHVQLRYIAYFIDKKTSRYRCGTIDKIIVVTAALVNFCNSVTTCMNYDLYVLFNFIQFKHSILIYKHHNTTQN